MVPLKWLAVGLLAAQEVLAQVEPRMQLDPVTVTATRNLQRSFDVLGVCAGATRFQYVLHEVAALADGAEVTASLP